MNRKTFLGLVPLEWSVIFIGIILVLALAKASPISSDNIKGTTIVGQSELQLTPTGTNAIIFVSSTGTASMVGMTQACASLGLGPLATLTPSGTASSSTYLNGMGAYTTVPSQFNPTAGTNISLSGTYPNITISGTTQAQSDYQETTTSAVDYIKNKPQSIRAQTNSTGSYTWTYPTPYPAGVVPIIQCLTETSSATIPQGVQIVGTPTNTSVTVQVINLPSTSVLGIIVLGAPTQSQAYVHLTATRP